jgi:hypothetical protein
MEDPEHFESEPELADLEGRRREAWRSVREAGGGEQDGFEMAEDELIEHASHGDEHNPAKIFQDATDDEAERPPEETYGEPDEENKPD